jgi:hypothetical protein
MPVWEYKVITSGKGGFATPALMESFLNQLGRDEWEILDFRQLPDNPLAFTGLARRPTQRDWTLEDAVAAAARTEADKLRAEFEAKFKGTSAAPAEEKVEGVATEEKAASEEGYRKVRDTERDMDPDAPEDDGEGDEWDNLTSGDELPTFFEAIRPHMRRNQRGPGLSVGVDHLARRWELTEDEVISALKECGFTIPEDEDAKPECLEYEGDLYWVNINRRGERWINTKEKPRAMFRIAKGTRPAEGSEAPEGEAAPAAEKPPADSGRQHSGRGRDRGRDRDAAPASAGPLPSGQELLERIRPLMRRSRRGPGGSGSLGFLSRALKCSEGDLAAGFVALGLKVPESQGEKPVFVEIGDSLWWINHDQRGGVWINERDKRDSEAGGEGAEPAPSRQDAPADAGAVPAGGSPLAALRLLLKKTKTGSHSGETGHLAATLGKTPDELLSALTAVGLHVPEKPRAKPVFVEHAGEIFWLNRNSKGELWLNAKASKYSNSDTEHGGEAQEAAVQEPAAQAPAVQEPAVPAPAEAPKVEAAPSE